MRSRNRSPRILTRAGHGTAGRARAALFVLVLALAPAACDGPGVAAPGGARFGRVGAVSTSVDFVGTWRRAVFFLDDFGIARSTETSWQFGADGSAARVQVTRNLTFGLADVVVSAGRYRVENSRILVDIISPVPTQLDFEVRRVQDQLFIAGEAYLRVGG